MSTLARSSRRVLSPFTGQLDEIWRVLALARRLESAATTATPKLVAVDFVSEERPPNRCVALLSSGLPRRQRAASLPDRIERSQDSFFEHSGWAVAGQGRACAQVEA